MSVQVPLRAVVRPLRDEPRLEAKGFRLHVVDLIREGLAREFVNKVQNMRKAADLDVTQRIRLVCAVDDEVRRSVLDQLEYVQTETLCVETRFAAERPENGTEWDLNGHPCVLRLETT